MYTCMAPVSLVKGPCGGPPKSDRAVRPRAISSSAWCGPTSRKTMGKEK